MTRRRAIAATGLCALLLPGCLNGKLADPRTGRPGIVLIEPSRGQGLYGKSNPSGTTGADASKQELSRQATDRSHGASPTDHGPANAVDPRGRAGQVSLGGPPPLPPPDQLNELLTTPPVEPPPADAAVGADWENLSRALSKGQLTSIRRTSTTPPAGPAAMLDLPVKAGPLTSDAAMRSFQPADSSMKLSDAPPQPQEMPRALPDLGPPPSAIEPAPAPSTSGPQDVVPLQSTTPAPAPNTNSLIPPPDAALDSPLLLAIRAYQDKQPDKALEYLKQYDAANQEVLLYLMPLMVRLSEGNLGTMSPEELAAFVDRLQGATGLMRHRAALRLDTVCFCRRVLNYGKYEPREPRHAFQPGEPVHLYTEIRNFTWEQATPVVASAAAAAPAAAHGFTMRLQNTLEIRDALGKVVWRADVPKSDTRQAPLTDYYLAYSFAMPAGLPPGAYTLEVKVADKPTGRVVRKSIEFRIGVKQ